jgi:hypothetical protein
LASKPVVMVSGGLTSKPTATVSGGLDSKPNTTVSSGLALKPAVTFFQFGPQNWQLRFGDLGLKITAMISWFGPQNHAGYGLPAAPQNFCEDAMEWDTRRDLAACFLRKQVRLGFPSLALRLVEA